MSLVLGQALSHYTILGPLGSGAMGEVYRARDTRLDREVAIKVLPEQFSKDQERLQRFAREAKSLAALNHPNVAQIHGVDQVDDTYFLVLELVPGETLAERLSRGPLAVEEALQVCVQVAAGLEAAHEAGVIHRDLKPGNIKITPEGKAKVLDFGLARQEVARQKPGSSAAGPLTEEGVLLGTPGYMSPEQVRGRTIDRRTDIFAFGCVLFVCLVGTPAFEGDTSSDVIAAILEREPDLEALPRRVSRRVRELLAKCFVKDQGHRLRDIGDARIELECAIANKEWSTARLETSSAAPGAGRTRRTWMPWSAGIAFGAVAALAIAHFAAPRLQPDAPAAEAAPRSVARFVVNPVRLLAVGECDTTATVAISPDGARIAFLAREAPEADLQLYLRELDSLEATPVAGSARAHEPFFSPDGQWLGFVVGDRLWKVPVRGGPRVELTKLSGTHKGSIWGAQGILTCPAANSGLFRLAADGGELEAFTQLDAAKGEASQRWPELLPDGRHVLCTIKKNGLASFDDADIAVYSIDSGEWKTVLHGGCFAKYARTGHLLYMREGGIMAAPFDVERLEVLGPAIRVVPGVMSEPGSGAAQFALSENGTLVYAPGGPVEGLVDVVWIDREGKQSPAGIPARPLRELALAPDGARVALIITGATDAVFVYDFARGTLTRATSEGNAYAVAWTPDGENLYYGSDRDTGGLFRSRSDGSGTATKLFPKILSNLLGRRMSLLCPGGSPQSVIYAQGKPGAGDIWSCSMTPGAVETPLVLGPYDQWDPQVSRNGKWLAYLSDESGRAELYVTPYPSGAGRFQISKDGAASPIWSADGAELLFLSGETSEFANVSARRTLLSVSVTTTDSFVSGPPKTAFEWTGLSGFDLSPDGKRLLVMRPRQPPVRSSEIHAVLNWFEELRRLAPLPAGR